ncbi:MAG: rhomboid family intramembrane serine protease [Planctomycetales bacterium]|nr:rhomboid family intramembrane serine protease [Planctomycetales bacterium]
MMIRFLSTVPFTLFMLSGIVLAAVATRTHITEMAVTVRRDLGFSPMQLAHGEWIRLFSSVFFTVGGIKFYASALMLAACVGIAERLHGTIRVAALFWGVHLVTLLVTSLAVAFPLRAMDIVHGTLLFEVHDVGPSAGYYGCLGVSCMSLPARWRHAAGGAIMTIIAMRLLWSVIAIPDQGRALAADVAHLVAFPLGLASGALLARRTPPA